MSWLEISLSGGAVLITSLMGTIRYFTGYGIDFISVGSFILALLVIALNIVIKRGGSVAVLMFAIVTLLYLFIIGMIVGIPTKAPVFTVNNTEIKLAHTTAKELIDNGFDIYINKNENSHADYNELISSGSFKKYSADRSVYVEKGFRRNDAAVEYSPYLFAKGGVVIGSVWLYGNDDKDIILEDCKVVHIELNEDSIKALRANSISCKLNGLDLIAPIESEEVKKAFGNKLWLAPDNPKDITELHYGIKWSTGSNHLFWNEYYSYINYDWNKNMTSFEISSEIARDNGFL
ncbi:hypothetical protein [Atopobium fossor]|uniref:hypothetical protein n=1 Tax=Atopobium fossor TaxID=39487 RepID=UPI0006841101|nr:hypothetical protein [Atopobium fossor]